MAKRRESGSALIVTVMLLLLLGVIGLSALDTVMRDQQVAGFQNRSTAAFYAAEAGLSRGQGRDPLARLAPGARRDLRLQHLRDARRDR